ncbi:hypothetical protein ACWWD9_08230 [Methylovorus sp. SPW-M1]
MLNLLLMGLLAAILFSPPYLLHKKGDKLKWKTRYFLSILPALYTGMGWEIARVGENVVNCQGGIKNLHGCVLGGFDITPLIGYGFFLLIPFFYLALPLSLWLFLKTMAKQLNAWYKKSKGKIHS